MMTIMERIRACGIVPVVVLEDVAQAVPTARALLAGGIDVMEITFRTAAARDAIAAVAKEVPEILVGAGTVVNPQQVEQALEAGAKFLVSPGIDEAVLEAAQAHNAPILPGIVTPSEIMVGLKYGLEIFKFFPAGNYGGLKTIKALMGPFPNLYFMPTGGVSTANAAEYLAEPRIWAVGGSWMVKASYLKENNYEAITADTKEAMALFHQVRG